MFLALIALTCTYGLFWKNILEVRPTTNTLLYWWGWKNISDISQIDWKSQSWNLTLSRAILGIYSTQFCSMFAKLLEQ